MNDTATKWHAQRETRQPDADDYELIGLAAMDDKQAEQSFHRWKKFNKMRQMAKGVK